MEVDGEIEKFGRDEKEGKRFREFMAELLNCWREVVDRNRNWRIGDIHLERHG
jgi:hypothetical protein